MFCQSGGLDRSTCLQCKAINAVIGPHWTSKFIEWKWTTNWIGCGAI